MRNVLAAIALTAAGTGMVAWSPLGEPLRAPLLDVYEAYDERPRPHSGAHVDDRMNVLGPHVVAIEELAARFWSDLGIDVQVVTTSARGDVLSVVAERLFQERRSHKRHTTGALLVVIDTAERRARIETSYELEGAFPDIVVGRLARDQLAPYASYQAVGMGVMDVLHLLRDVALDQAARGNLPLAEELRAGPAVQGRLAQISGGGGARAELPELPIDLDLKRAIQGAERARYAPSAHPRESLQAFRRVLHDLVGDPTLELFTPGSQVQRRYTPMAPYESWLRLSRIDASRPLRIVREGDRAVAVSDKPAHGFVPVLLRRDDGLWRVDLVETWKNLFFTPEGDYMLHNTSSPYAFGLRHLAQGRMRGLEPVDLGDAALLAALERLESPADAHQHLELAELLLRNCFAAVAALSHYEEAVRLAPDDPEVARVYGERALYFGYARLAVRHLKTVGPAAWHRVAHAYAVAGDYPRAARYYRRALRRNPRSAVARAGLKWLRARD
jgi:uncharacterized protein